MDQTLRLKKELNCKVSSTTRTGKVYRKRERAKIMTENKKM